ncbi:MAG: hypothetical protein DHS20C16_16050 [Phycisphaerae bacterium]|nr:MAG: hypothetical protein DHS20C16_16050 [Phycisphaerae bacterium]
MATDCLPAKSLVEASLYFLVTPCPVCQSDRLDPQDAAAGEDSNTVEIVGVCRNCGGSESYQFSVEHVPPTKDRHDPISGTHAINLGPARSRLIDLVQWVTLYEILLEKVKSEPIAAEARWLRIRAGQCLDEAIKFFEGGAESPSVDATFVASSQKKVIEHADRYTRSRLTNLRNQLPAENAFKEAQSDVEPRRPWWKFW